MKKILLLLIGIILIGIPFHKTHAVFNCVSTFSNVDLYKRAYCDATEEDEEDIFEMVANQFAVEDPKFDSDIVEFILFKTNQITIRDYLEGVYGDRNADDKLPKIIKQAFIDNPDAGRQGELYRQVKTAYDREKVMNLTQKSLTQEFKSREIWADGSMLNTPFDLITDLNLIEIVLFGSDAEWMDDVWSHPPSQEEESPEDSEDSGDEDSGSEDSSDEGPTEASGSGEPSDNDEGGDYECIPNDEYEDLFGEEPNESENGNAGEIPENCGNRQIDEGEYCDDGNSIAGDGCSLDCQLEESNSLMCRDPEAVTFKKHENSDVGAGSTLDASGDGDGESDSDDSIVSGADCPDGSVGVNASDLADARAKNPPQHPNYDPNVPGTLKVFPVVDQNKCPAGTTWAEVQIGSKVVGRCFDTDKLCADFEDFRKIGDENYEDPPADVLEEALEILEKKEIPSGSSEEEIKEIIKSANKEASDKLVELLEKYAKGEIDKDGIEGRRNEIAVKKAFEVSVCVDVKKVKRPESPYPVIEGCVNCHIMAMNDIMSEMLGNPVFPMENNMAAWGMSNRFGPNLSFNLNAVVQSAANAISKPKYSGLTKKEESDLQANQLLQDATHQLDPNADQPDAGVDGLFSSVSVFHDKAERQAEEERAYLESLKNYRLSSSATADQEVFSVTNQLLIKFLGKFKELQEQYEGLAIGVSFPDKDLCSF